MSKQTIRKARPKEKYIILPNSTAQNTALSYEALGMLTYIQSLPDDWILHANTLPRAGSGRDKAYRILAELIKLGYAKRETIYNEKHRIVAVEYTVSSLPDFLNLADKPQSTVNPLPENPYTEIPDTENPQLQSKYSNKVNKKNLADKPQSTRNRLFDGVSLLCFNINAEDKNQEAALEANAGRIGKIVAFLKKVQSTPEKLWAFKKWYCNKYPENDMPNDLAKFTKHYNDFASVPTASQAAAVIYAAPQSSVSDNEQESALAILRASKNGVGHD